MARLSYILLCHQNPDLVISQARLLTSQGDCLAIHVDRAAGPGVYEAIRDGLQGQANIVFAERVRCGWGEWSLVQATLNGIAAARAAFRFSTHFYLVSGDCMPIKPAAFIHRFLDENDADFIEHSDFATGGWIKTGLREERVIYRHYFNERRQRRWFYRSLALQQRFGLQRRVPAGLTLKIGSQWWCLRRGTVEKLLEFVESRPDITRFFRTTWIPDETFFQTLVPRLVPVTELRNAPPTLLMFSDYGMPVVFHADHFDLLREQVQLFARKISAGGNGLRQSLATLFAAPETRYPTIANAETVYRFVAWQGRSGARHAPRIWENGRNLGQGNLLLVISCKKWHVGQRLAEAIAAVGGPEGHGYVFDDNGLTFPQLGGFGSTLSKRLAHRRAFLKLLAQIGETDRLTICVDPANLEAIRDLASDGCTLHVLQVDCAFDDNWLIGHADRVGLEGSRLGEKARRELVTALRQGLSAEIASVRRLNLPGLFRITEGGDPDHIAEELAAFSGIAPGKAREIASDPALLV